MEIEEIKAVRENLEGNDPAIVKLVMSASLYISEDADPDAAQRRILRYIKCGDCIGFHSLFLHKAKESRARQEYELFLSGKIRVDDYFSDFGQTFRDICVNSGLDFGVA